MLPVGGVRDKVLAARRGGIRHVLLPARNRGDLEELPREAAEGLRFTFVENIGDVIFALFPANGDGIHAAPPEQEEEMAADEAGGGAPRSTGFQSGVQHSRGRAGSRAPVLRRQSAGEAAGGGRRGGGWEAEDVAGELLESFL